jgi:hypothetical protein
MGRIGPVLLLPIRQHTVGEETTVRDIGGMLHKAVQLVGEIDGAEIVLSGSIDPSAPRAWTEIARLTAVEPYKHHTGWIRWIKIQVITATDKPFGVAGMGED